MKKRLSVFILLVVLMVVAVSAASAAYYVSGTSWLKVHTEPRDSAGVTGSFRTDYAVTSLKKYDSNWAYVTFSSGDKGYVRTKYLKTSSKSTAYVKADDTVLRKGPAATFGSVATLSKGTKVTVVTKGSNWSYVTTSSGNGYLRRSGLSSKYVAPSKKTSPYTAYIVSPNSKKVNVRRGAGNGYALVKQAEPGAQVTVTSRGTKWSKITIDGINGYVLNTYLSKTKPATATTTTGAVTTAKTHT
ncbi:MAG: SH3 domain-containing protein, partial [Clostridia bacterium]|nr:SH3 domain-containing protein [Clostridia bacterium]